MQYGFLILKVTFVLHYVISTDCTRGFSRIDEINMRYRNLNLNGKLLKKNYDKTERDNFINLLNSIGFCIKWFSMDNIAWTDI